LFKNLKNGNRNLTPISKCCTHALTVIYLFICYKSRTHSTQKEQKAHGEQEP